MIEVANQVLSLFAPETSLHVKDGCIRVCWTDYRDRVTIRRWMTRGQDFYPVWHRMWMHGGTAQMALSQLVRWCQDRPVYPIGMWKHWCSREVYLGKENGPEIIRLLTEANYPQRATCVLCGTWADQYDWWSLNKVSGPCCIHTQGCRQKGRNDNGNANEETERAADADCGSQAGDAA